MTWKFINVYDCLRSFVLLIWHDSLIMGAEMVWINNLLLLYALAKSKSKGFGCIHTLLTWSCLFENTTLYRSIASLLYELLKDSNKITKEPIDKSLTISSKTHKIWSKVILLNIQGDEIIAYIGEMLSNMVILLGLSLYRCLY